MSSTNPVRKSRTIAIGDIHGHIKALVGLVDLINPNPEDTLVFLGDYINRGPDSKAVLQFVIDLKHRCNVVCIMGNHEEMMINAFEDPSKFGWFLENGGNATLQSYGNSQNLSLVPQAHKDFLLGLPLYHETDQHFFIHANYDYNVDLSDMDSSTALWRSLNGRPRRHISRKTAILGHTPQMNGEILDLNHLVCIDTGCGLGGKLTALEVISSRVTGRCWQVDEQGQEVK
jgi:serine/threonine protein phosphatase 1